MGSARLRGGIDAEDAMPGAPEGGPSEYRGKRAAESGVRKKKREDQ